MSQPIGSSTLHLNNPRVAAFFASSNNAKLLAPFMENECSLAEAAQALNLSKSHMSYWVGQMIQLELLKKVRIEKQGRYQVPLYRSTAEVFTVPLEQLPKNSEEALLETLTKDFSQSEQEAVLKAARQYGQGWYLRYSFSRGRPCIDVLPLGGLAAIPMFNRWGDLCLSPADAQAFRREMNELLERYKQKNNPNESEHLFKLLLVEAAK